MLLPDPGFPNTNTTRHDERGTASGSPDDTGAVEMADSATTRATVSGSTHLSSSSDLPATNPVAAAATELLPEAAIAVVVAATVVSTDAVIGGVNFDSSCVMAAALIAELVAELAAALVAEQVVAALASAPALVQVDDNDGASRGVASELGNDNDGWAVNFSTAFNTSIDIVWFMP